MHRQVLDFALTLGVAAGLHYLVQRPSRRTWQGFSPQALQGWGGYLRIALPSAATICLGWCARPQRTQAGGCTSRPFRARM
jgi:MATE family multidrug resistance protein